MLHYAGDVEAFELGEKGKGQIWMYEKTGQDVCKVPYRDLECGRERFIMYQKLNDQWVFVDLVD